MSKTVRRERAPCAVVFLKKLLDIAGISRGIEFKIKLSYLFNIPSPYIIKDGIRFLRGSNSLVSEKRNIYCINVLTNNILKFSSLTDCGKALSINRSTIKNYLISFYEKRRHATFWVNIASREAICLRL